MQTNDVLLCVLLKKYCTLKRQKEKKDENARRWVRSGSSLTSVAELVFVFDNEKFEIWVDHILSLQ